MKALKVMFEDGTVIAYELADRRVVAAQMIAMPDAEYAGLNADDKPASNELFKNEGVECANVVPCPDLRERAERMREHILRKVVSRLCDVPTGKWHGEWGCGLCGGVGKGPCSGEYDPSSIEHTADCMVAPFAESASQEDSGFVPVSDYANEPFPASGELGSVNLGSSPKTEIPPQAGAAIRYLLLTYSDLHREAVAERRPFVEVATGNMPQFLNALRHAANTIASPSKEPRP